MVPTEGLEPTPVEILSFLTLPIGLSGLNEKETVLLGFRPCIDFQSRFCLLLYEHQMTRDWVD